MILRRSSGRLAGTGVPKSRTFEPACWNSWRMGRDLERSLATIRCWRGAIATGV